jgi:2-polyprenyl-3-methyl-5-hydroxy-6-metoxy-1,4-benzoquinol methylase
MSVFAGSSHSADDILDRIRKRVLERKRNGEQPVPQSTALFDKAGPYDLTLLLQEVQQCSVLHSAVGTINPRPPGAINVAIQLIKRVTRRLLTWYTRPLHQFHASVTRALEESTKALQSINGELQSLEHRHSRLESMQQDYSEFAQLEGMQTLLQENIQYLKNQAMASVDSYSGPKATAGLWFNEPIIIQYDDTGRPSWARTSERIIEKAWILRHLSGLPAGACILDLGSAESILPLELASNGFKVTAVDVRPYPLRHPNLHFLQGSITTAPLEPGSFDVAVLLSTIEHMGLGWYGDPVGESVPEDTLTYIRKLLASGGTLLLTVPFGRPAITPLHRIFDLTSLTTLLRDFHIEVIEYGIKQDEKTWIAPASAHDAAVATHDPLNSAPGAVAMVVATKRK